MSIEKKITEISHKYLICMHVLQVFDIEHKLIISVIICITHSLQYKTHDTINFKASVNNTNVTVSYLYELFFS